MILLNYTPLKEWVAKVLIADKTYFVFPQAGGRSAMSQLNASIMGKSEPLILAHSDKTRGDKTDKIYINATRIDEAEANVVVDVPQEIKDLYKFVKPEFQHPDKYGYYRIGSDGEVETDENGDDVVNDYHIPSREEKAEREKKALEAKDKIVAYFNS